MRSGMHGPSRKPTPLEGCPTTRHRTVSVVHEAKPGRTHSGWPLSRLADPLWRTDLVGSAGASSGGRRLGPSALESRTMPPISVLDLAPIPQGSKPVDALRRTLDLAHAVRRASKSSAESAW